MKKFCTLLLILAMALTLACPVAAAGSPTLLMDGSGTGNARLTLQNLGDQAVNSVQLELTLSGSYPRTSFTSSVSPSGSYSRCEVEVSGNQTYITIYMDSLRTLNQGSTASLGTLNLGGGYTAPSSARLTILDRGLEPVNSGRTIPVRGTSSGGTSGGGGSSSAYYSVRGISVGRGTVSVRPTSAEKDETVTVTTHPGRGFQLSELTATGGGRRLQLNDKGDGVFSFVMPGADVEVRGVFTAVGETDLPFTDVKEEMWFHSAVKYA